MSLSVIGPNGDAISLSTAPAPAGNGELTVRLGQQTTQLRATPLENGQLVLELADGRRVRCAAMRGGGVASQRHPSTSADLSAAWRQSGQKKMRAWPQSTSAKSPTRSPGCTRHGLSSTCVAGPTLTT